MSTYSEFAHKQALRYRLQCLCAIRVAVITIKLRMTVPCMCSFCYHLNEMSHYTTHI